MKYFRKREPEWQIDPRIRDMIEFREINLLKPWPTLASMDIVFMWNVLIYFDMETRNSILSRVKRLLKPDGVLFLSVLEVVNQFAILILKKS